MGRHLGRWLASLLLAAVFSLSLAQAQSTTFDGTTETSSDHTAALPYTFSAIAVLVVLVMVCYPSRRS